jgi:hypothetical protein
VNTCPGLETPVAPLDLALSVQQMLPSAGLTASASTTTKDFGAEFLTAHVLAVYASHPSGHPVEWQDSLPGCQLRLCPGWTFTNKIPLKGFIYSCLIPPFPSFAWRDSPDFSLVIERARAMSSKHSICTSFEDLASEKQTVFFKQCPFSLQPTV